MLPLARSWVDVLTVGKVETAVVVLGIVSAMGPARPLCRVKFQIDIPLFLIFLCTATRAIKSQK